MFNITLENGNEINLSGRLDAAQIEKVDAVLDKMQGDCSVNFQELEYISSAGLGSLLKTHSRLRSGGHTIKLKNLNKHISEVFKYSRLNQIFTIE
ncbi:MAG TPA: STAS domain-containing protein [Ignavibacteriaceae bacterium]|nr:STAS domain-containing protein [Ignavibacteriaceae bacterium]